MVFGSLLVLGTYVHGSPIASIFAKSAGLLLVFVLFYFEASKWGIMSGSGRARCGLRNWEKGGSVSVVGVFSSLFFAFWSSLRTFHEIPIRRPIFFFCIRSIVPGI